VLPVSVCEYRPSAIGYGLTVSMTPSSEPHVASLDCQQCGAALAVRRFDKTVACPYCASSNVVKRPPRPGIPAPAFVLGFARPAEEVKALVARWGRHLPWHAPSGFRNMQVELLRPVYVPAYLFIGEAKVCWSASAGYTYVDKKDKKGLQCIEWHRVGGQTVVQLWPLLISASHQLKNEDLEALEPYDFGRIARYSDAAIAGWSAEEAARTLEQMDEALTTEVDAQLEHRFSGIVPGDEKTRPEVTWDLLDTHVDLVLVPVWTMLVRFSPTRPRLRVLVNGQTGKVWGKAPVSRVKVFLAAALGLAVVLGLVVLALQLWKARVHR
jgi:DNA-directed RNA polymerase subunit RPC12/RpoP